MQSGSRETALCGNPAQGYMQEKQIMSSLVYERMISDTSTQKTGSKQSSLLQKEEAMGWWSKN